MASTPVSSSSMSSTNPSSGNAADSKGIPPSNLPTSPAPATANTLTFNDIRLGELPTSSSTSSGDSGPFRIMGDIFGWKNLRTKEVIQFEAGSVVAIRFGKLGSKECFISVRTKENEVLHFRGFKESDWDLISRHAKHHWPKDAVDLKQVRVASRGWHWGTLEKAGKRQMEWIVDGKGAFNIDTANVQSLNLQKGELNLGFVSRASEGEDELVEMRLLFPSGPDISAEGAGESAAHYWKEFVSESSGHIKSGVAESIITFPYKQCHSPPGRFDIHVYLERIRLAGRSLDFDIPWQNIASVYHLPNPSSAQMGTSLLLNLQRPLRKGNTQYSNVILQLDEKATGGPLSFELLIDQETFKTKLVSNCPIVETKVTASGSNKQVLDDINFEVDIMEWLIEGCGNLKPVRPAKVENGDNLLCFRCSQKASSGYFYAFSNVFIFMPKPCLIVQHKDIAQVLLSRALGGQRSFEFRLVTKEGGNMDFQSVDKSELDSFTRFLNAQNLKVKTMVALDGETEDRGTESAELEGESDEEDEDFQGEDESSSDDEEQSDVELEDEGNDAD